ncbi:MAG: hypothetical protein JHC95_14820 [Solirubrobacteraceae bacterium]|nr:hypothetical protein [Solirubrobacteraceae bacterium]
MLRSCMGLGLAALLTLAAAAPTQGMSVAAKSMKGKWRGTLSQKMTPPFTVTVDIRSFDRFEGRNPVKYGAPLNCTGHWRYTGAEGNVYRFKETITGGKSDTCKGTGRIRITWTDDDRLQYRFTGGGVTSTGTLRPVED